MSKTKSIKNATNGFKNWIYNNVDIEPNHGIAIYAKPNRK